jgi:hypothetical protein
MVVRVLVCLVYGLSLVLTGCGGGGGSSPAPALAPTPVAPPDVSIRTDPNTSSKILAHIPMDSPSPVLTVRGVAQGNVGALNGKTIYAVVEDREGLLQGQPKVVVDTNSPVFGVELALRAQQDEGLRKGAFSVYACLDPECKAQLQGSPLSYEYELKWIKPLRSSLPTINAARVYGSTDDVRLAFSITAPKDGTLSAAMAMYDDPDFQVVTADPRFGLSLALPVSAIPDWAVVLRFEPASPGVHASSVHIDSTEPGVGGVSWRQFLSLPVRYEVLDNPAIALAFSPAVAQFSMSTSDVAAYRFPEAVVFRSLPRAGDNLQFKGIRYTGSPPTAAALPLAQAWLRVANWSGNVNRTTNRWTASIGPALCSVSGATGLDTACLPTGIYTAVALFDVQRSTGAVVEVGFPVTFEIRN